MASSDQGFISHLNIKRNMPQDSKAGRERPKFNASSQLHAASQRMAAAQDNLKTLPKLCPVKTPRPDAEGNGHLVRVRTTGEEVTRPTPCSKVESRQAAQDLLRAEPSSDPRVVGSTSNVWHRSQRPSNTVKWSTLVSGNKEASMLDTQYVKSNNSSDESLPLGQYLGQPGVKQNSGGNLNNGNEESAGPGNNCKNTGRVSYAAFFSGDQVRSARSHGSFDPSTHSDKFARVSDPSNAWREQPMLGYPESTPQELSSRGNSSDSRRRWPSGNNDAPLSGASKDCSDLKCSGHRSKAGSKFKNLIRDYKIKLPNPPSVCAPSPNASTDTRDEHNQTAMRKCSENFKHSGDKSKHDGPIPPGDVNAALNSNTLFPLDNFIKDQNATGDVNQDSDNSSPDKLRRLSSENLATCSKIAPLFEGSQVSLVQSNLSNLSLATEQYTLKNEVANEPVDGENVSCSRYNNLKDEQRMPVSEASTPISSQTNCNNESNRATNQTSTKHVEFKSSINAEIQEEMARAESMSLPVSFKPRGPVKDVSSNLNPSAHEFSPTLTDGNGNWFSMCSSKGVYYFRPQSRPRLDHTPGVEAGRKENFAPGNANAEIDENQPQFQTSTSNAPDVCGSYVVAPSDNALVSSGQSSDPSNDAHLPGTYSSLVDSALFSNNHPTVSPGYLTPVSSIQYPENFRCHYSVVDSNVFPNTISLASDYTNYQPMGQDGQLNYAFSTFQDPALWTAGLHASASETHCLLTSDPMTTVVHPGVQQLGCFVSIPGNSMPYLPPMPDPMGVYQYGSMLPAHYESMPNLQSANLTHTGMPVSHYTDTQSSGQPEQHMGVRQLPSEAMANPSLLCMGPPPPFGLGPSPPFSMMVPPTSVSQAPAHGGMWAPPSNFPQSSLPAGPIFQPNTPLAVSNYASLPNQISKVEPYTSTAHTPSYESDLHYLRTRDVPTYGAQTSVQYGVKNRPESSDPASFPPKPRRFSQNRHRYSAANAQNNYYPEKNSLGGPLPVVSGGAKTQDSAIRCEDPALRAVMSVTADKLMKFMRTNSADRLWSLRDSLTDQDKSDISTVQTLLGFMSSLQSSVPNMSEDDFKELLMLNLEALQPFLSIQDSAFSKYSFNLTNESCDKFHCFTEANKTVANTDGEINEKSWPLKESKHEINEYKRGVSFSRYHDNPVSCEQGRTSSQLKEGSRFPPSAPRTESHFQGVNQISSLANRRSSQSHSRGNKSKGKSNLSFTNNQRSWRHNRELSSADRPLRRNM
ncbi:hypothetical protein Btru_018690 [Bulinus truncatus]|nr:hypothetical protein Btru_018690 [Bulinus truncatus]